MWQCDNYSFVKSETSTSVAWQEYMQLRLSDPRKASCTYKEDENLRLRKWILASKVLYIVKETRAANKAILRENKKIGRTLINMRIGEKSIRIK